ncbi:sulfite exporter TauE/SafE family protein [Haloflavibacter putidus]|uniref:Probable membrane transporter protein n=1 Tax=Haloflavibacter putidus TaxID=2576776 RepID=A0A507ZNU9_9FLAO|nr:sulfite exporter TauE/SafE family protein [Haloflavibacter putidus]TQD39416.1 sulfite exporter TauE/SafE family protein [Haloflavibacter putidus]
MLIEILGYIGALLIGVVLGLTGGGGSILTVPIFVYVLSIEPVIATGYSLFVVGLSSLFGTFKNLRNGMVNYKAALLFAIPAVSAVFLTRKFLIPAIPETIAQLGKFTLHKDMAIMVFFAVLMLIASVSMIKTKKETTSKQKAEKKSSVTNYTLLLVLGAFTGLITGLVGAGGGFIIVPILVLLAKLPMKKAAATSLFIIAINSLLGFLGDVTNFEIDWIFLLSFSAIAIAGIYLGIYLNRFINGKKLKKAFGWLVLVMGIYIVWRELF